VKIPQEDWRKAQTKGREVDQEQWIEEERKIKRNVRGESPSW